MARSELVRSGDCRQRQRGSDQPRAYLYANLWNVEQFPQANGDVAMTAADKFQCPFCEAQYDVVRVEVQQTHDKALICLNCGAPLHNREGRFALKYFRVSDGVELGRRNGRRPGF